MTGSVVLALGLSPVVTLGTDLIVGSAPAERAGAASSLSETGAELGGALGIAVLGSIGTAVYRRMMADAVPASVPHEIAEAARGTLGERSRRRNNFPARSEPSSRVLPAMRSRKGSRRQPASALSLR